jgi:hypothetical protein
LSKQHEFVIPEQFVAQKDSEGAAEGPAETVKKSFVEPEISAPVDVLEATTFFMSTTSGPSAP